MAPNDSPLVMKPEKKGNEFPTNVQTDGVIKREYKRKGKSKKVEPPPIPSTNYILHETTNTAKRYHAAAREKGFINEEQEKTLNKKYDEGVKKGDMKEYEQLLKQYQIYDKFDFKSIIFQIEQLKMQQAQAAKRDATYVQGEQLQEAKDDNVQASSGQNKYNADQYQKQGQDDEEKAKEKSKRDD
jgi:hypothetical protein